MSNNILPKKVIVRLPPPHPGGQSIFLNWNVDNPKAQALIAPCGTKSGKSFGSSLWLLTEAMTNPGFYCIVIAPTYLKCRIIYRYIKRMLPPIELAKPVDGKLEIWFANGTTIKFLHGRDAETVIEGEAVDRFVIDEAGKINRQVWYSLFTTITQTGGKGIVTGTPRGHTWYYDLFVLAQSGDSFFCWVTLPTSASPYVSAEAIETARRLLPHVLFVQYYLAQFVTHGSVFGDLSRIFYDDPNINPKTKFWVHPDSEMRKNEVVHGVDVAKKNDYTVFYSVNGRGQLVGYCRFKQVPYPSQVIRLKTYLINYFSSADNHIKYDATGVGVAFGDMLNEADIDAAITPVVFTNRSKNEMVTKTIMALDSGFHKAPKILRIVHEYSIYELTMTSSGLYRFAAPEGEHDDIISAAIIAVSEAYSSNQTDGAERLLAGELANIDESDMIAAYLSDDQLIDESESFFADDSDDDISGFIDDDID